MSAPAPFLVGAERRRSADAVEIRSPFDGRAVSSVAQASAAEADEAAALASRAFDAFERTSTGQRAHTLRAAARRMEERQEELARSICEEAGKPIALARAEVQRAVDTFRIAAGEAERLGGELLPIDRTPGTAGYRCLVRRVARGPVLAIGPFNFPLNLLAHKIAPAIAVGAPVVVKPPPQAPTAALLLGEILLEVAPDDWPEGFVSVLPCDNAVAESLVRDDRFAVLSFTGSSAVGWKLKAIAGRKHVVLELGGDAAVIVTADADVEKAARRIAWGANAYAGQVCISVQRVLAHESVRDRLEHALQQATGAIAYGDPRDAKVVSGPLISASAADRVEAVIEQSRRSGRVLSGGSRQGQTIAPTLIADPPRDGTLVGEEVFGPVSALWSYSRFDDALAEINRSPFGLQAGLFTNNLRETFEAHDTLRVGGLIVNDVPTLRVDNYPYGGTKGSGLGREGGSSALEEYTEPRVLVLNPAG